MYEELVERLKIAAEWTGKGFCITPSLCLEAADAIENLMNISNSILSKYKIAADTVIWEYSVKINEDSDKLLKEVDNYKAQINGDAKPLKEE